MKKILAILSIGFLLSCTDHFAELNTDKKSPASVTGESLFNNGVVNLNHRLHNANVNTNVFRLYAQYWAQTTYPEESQYQMVQRSIPDRWFSTVYKDVLKDLDEAKKIIGAQETNVETAPIQKNKLAIISIVEVQAYATLIDLFGNIPYTDALDFANPSPKYDDAKTVFYSLIDKLDKAITDLDASKASFDSSDDLLNQGDTGAWKKAANSLKLRMAMRIADTDAAKAKSMAEAAVASGVFESVSEDLSLEYIASAPYTNPAYEDLVLSGRSDYVAANTIVDIMVGLDDPRLPLYFQQNLGDGVYEGGIYGTANSFANSTRIGSFMYGNPSLPGVSISYSEVLFLMAEGAARGFNMGSDAETLYNAAITASVEEYGGSAESAAAYIASPDVAYDAANWKQKIGLQKWISLFNNGLEGWASWRLFDTPTFNVPEGLTYDDIPKRLIYPINEATLNGESLKAAQSAIGGDTPQTKVFWDVN